MNTRTLTDLNMVFAFEDLATTKGWPAARNDADTEYADPLTQARWEGFELAHGPHGVQPVGQQLFAEIKKTSKYAHQATWAKNQGEYPFPVRVVVTPDEYCVSGGPGGQYRLSDLNLYVMNDGKKRRLA